METATSDRTRPPAGGMWERERLYGGERMADTFQEGEEFGLLDLEVVGEIEVDDDRTATKTVLQAVKLDSGERLEVGTLASSIAQLAQEDRGPNDLPAVVYWTEVPTDLQPATVLRFVRLAPELSGASPADDGAEPQD